MNMKNIFRKYDIRGIHGKDLTNEIVYSIGLSFGTKLKIEKEKDEKIEIIIAYDGRLSSIETSKYLISGLNDSGVNVINIGLMPTPTLYYATNFYSTYGIMITGSHNPKEYNGMKIVKDCKPFFDKDIFSLYAMIENKSFLKQNKIGTTKNINIKNEYINYIFQNLKIDKKKKVIFDSANGATGEIITSICSYFLNNSLATFSNIDGNFPNHHADPSDKKNLQTLIENVKKEKADLGCMFDGDGDRVAFVDEKGNALSNEEMIYIFASDVINKNKNKKTKIVLDIKCSYYLIKSLETLGAQIFITKTGHPYIKAKMKEVFADFGAELSGHIFFLDKYLGFDDGIYASLRMLEILSDGNNKLSDLRKNAPKTYGGLEIKIKSTDESKFETITKLKNKLLKNKIQFIEIDGVKIITEKGSILIRASNTTPDIIIVCNSHTEEYLEELESESRIMLNL